MAGKIKFTLKKLVSFLIRLNFIHYNNHIAHMFHTVIAHPRYFLGGHRPSKTSILTTLSFQINYYVKNLIRITKL